MNYDEFLKTKAIRPASSGFDIDESELNDSLFPFQKKIVKQALSCGKYAIFADCGLGKTIMQLSWADQVAKKTKGKVLILAPLAVSKQTQKEGEKFGIGSCVIRSSEDEAEESIHITNYEMLDHFDLSQYQGIVLDESSILKNFMGKVRNAIIDGCEDIPYKLACTATPSPNDFVELGNHCEFLNVLSMN